MLKSKAPKYDFGGAEEYKSKHYIIVDILPESKFRKLYGNEVINMKYIRHNLKKPILLTPGDKINVSRLLRYAGNSSGYLIGDKIPVKGITNIIKNIDNNLLPDGEVTIVDHKKIAETAVEMLQTLNYKIKMAKRISLTDEDYEEEWIFKLIKSINV